MRVKCLKYHKFKGERLEGTVYDDISDEDAKKLIGGGWYEEIDDDSHHAIAEKKIIKLPVNKMIKRSKKNK